MKSRNAAEPRLGAQENHDTFTAGTAGTATSPVGAILSGGDGADRLLAGAERILRAAIGTGETVTPSGKTTLMLAGNDGNDQLVGAAGGTANLKDWQPGHIHLIGEAQEPKAPATTPQSLTSRADNNKVDYLRASAVRVDDSQLLLPNVVVEPGQLWRIDSTATVQSQAPRLPAGAVVDVTGHSLGGHLATAFSRLFTSNTANVVTINGAGYSVLGMPTANVDRVFATLGGSASFPSGRILNIYGDRGPEIVTQDFGLQQPGDHRLALLEDWNALTNTLGHGSGQMSLSLAMYDTLRRLKEGSASDMNAMVMLDTYKEILRSGSNDQYQDYEALIDSLRRIILSDTERTTIGDANSFHTRLIGLRDSDEFQSLVGHVNVLSATNLQSRAKTDFGAFLALQFLSPVVLSTNDAAALATLKNAHAQMATDWQADMNARLYGDTDYPYSYTEQWYADRSAMLAVVLERNRQDIGGIMPSSQNIAYRDAASSTEVLVGAGSAHRIQVLFGADAADTFSGQGFADRLYGGGGADTLTGLGGNDHLEGGSGNDTLDGGAGNDTLLGGSGVDTYLVAANSGRDTIIDADGQGTIQLDGRTLSGVGELISTASAQQPHTLWQDNTQPDQPIRYQLHTTTRELTITGAGSTIVVKGFDAADLGISAPVASPPAVPPAQYVFDLSTSAGRAALAALTPQQRQANLRLDNAIFANGQYLSASTGSGNDTITGGIATSPAGAILSGGDGDDRLWAGVEGTLQAAIDAGETTTPSGSATLMLAGNDGDDQLIGAAGDDVLFGGRGDDTIVGGGGNDTILADGDNASYAAHAGVNAWAEGGSAENPNYWLRMRVHAARVGVTEANSAGQRTVVEDYIDMYINPLANTDLSGLLAMRAEDIVPAAGDTRLYQPGTQITYAQLHGGQTMGTNIGQGHDVIHAGAGNDIVNAGAGDDVVFAGSGNDDVAGYEGDDFIDGGDGDDILWGDFVAQGAQPQQETHAHFGAAWSIALDLDPARHGRDVIFGGNGSDTIVGGGAADELYGGLGDDLILGDDQDMDALYAGEDLLDGGEGNDILDGGAGADVLLGGQGDDLLIGGEGNDWLDGGGGRDDLFGGTGDDTYVVRGVDLARPAPPAGASFEPLALIDDEEGRNRIRLDAIQQDVTLLRLHTDGSVGVSLLWTMAVGGQEQVAVLGVKTLESAATFTVEFADGRHVEMARWMGDVLDAPVSVQSSTPGTMVAGAAGDDHLAAYGSGSQVMGGRGDDTIVLGGLGSTVRFDRGDGSDEIAGGSGHTIAFGPGIASEDFGLRLMPDGSVSIVVRDADGHDNGDRITLPISPWSVTQSSFISEIRLADGGTLTWQELVARGVLVEANTGATWLPGTDARDLFTVTASGATFEGGQGDDWYHVGVGANGAIRDTQGLSRIVLSTEVASDWGSVSLQRGAPDTAGRLSNDLLLTAGGVSVVLTNALLLADRFEIALADGSIRTLAELIRPIGPLAIDGSEGGDHIVGGDADDVLAGQAGDDTLVGQGGSDVLLGGMGNDVYMVDLGPGHDQIADLHGENVVRFAADVEAGALRVERQDETTDVRFWIGHDRSLLVMSALDEAVARYEFADGTVWTPSDLVDTVQNVEGTAGNDVLSAGLLASILNGFAGDDMLTGSTASDTLIGGLGNDRLRGLSGPDTYVFNPGAGGFGNDVVYESPENEGVFNTIRFEQGVSPADAVVSRSRASLDLRFPSGDSVRIINWFHGVSESFNAISFADGQQLTAEQIRVMANNAPVVSVAPDDEEALEGEAISLTLDPATFTDPDAFIGETLTYEATMADGSEIPTWLTFDAAALAFSAPQGASVVGLLSLRVIATDAAGLQAEALFSLDVQSDNNAPVLNRALTPQQSFAGSAFTYVIPADTFTDADTGDVLALNVDWGDGAALPGWLSFDAGTLTLSGTPLAAQRSLLLKVTAMDGAGASAQTTLLLHVSNLIEGTDEDQILTGTNFRDVINGYGGNDTLIGGSGVDMLRGGLGNDTYAVGHADDQVIELAGEGMDTVQSALSFALGHNIENLTLTGSAGIHGTGNELDNVLTGNLGANNLWGGEGNDDLTGLAGNDTLYGGNGNDTYRFSRAYGIDTVNDDDGGAGSADLAIFGAGVAADQLWFRKVSNNLEVSIMGTGDRLTVSNWYLGDQYRVEQFQTADNQTLLSSQVDNLVQAMAAFAPPRSGQTTFTPAQQSALSPVIAANWN